MDTFLSDVVTPGFVSALVSVAANTFLDRARNGRERARSLRLLYQLLYRQRQLTDDYEWCMLRSEEEGGGVPPDPGFAPDTVLDLLARQPIELPDEQLERVLVRQREFMQHETAAFGV